MTLYELITNIQNIAKNIPNINSISEGDIYTLNQSPTMKYKSFVITQQPHTENPEDNTITYHFYLFEVDRLQLNNGNKLQIQSTALEDLHIIIKQIGDLDDVINVDSVTYNTFEHRFNDLCSGAYADVTITTSINDCNVL
jgi:hypothetical protein